jgi:hypothetical protein
LELSSKIEFNAADEEDLIYGLDDISENPAYDADPNNNCKWSIKALNDDVGFKILHSLNYNALVFGKQGEELVHYYKEDNVANPYILISGLYQHFELGIKTTENPKTIYTKAELPLSLLGGNLYYNKYIKYKIKYLQLKTFKS